MKEQKELGRDDFTKIPTALPASSIASRSSTTACRESHFAQSLCRAHFNGAAKMFGLFPKKGTIAVGSDADIVIFDAKEQTISVKTHHMNVDTALTKLDDQRRGRDRAVARFRCH